MLGEKLTLDFLKLDDSFIIYLKNTLNSLELKKIEQVIQIVKKQGFEEIILDLSKVKYLDQHSIDALESFYNKIQTSGIILKLVLPFGLPAYKQIEKYLPSFSQIFFPSITAALNSFYDSYNEFYYDVSKLFFPGQIFNVSFSHRNANYSFFAPLQKVDMTYMFFIWPRDKEKNLYPLIDFFKINFTFLTIKGVFNFQKEIIKKSFQINPPLFIIKKPKLEEIKKIQRRLFDRINIKSIINYKIVGKSGIPIETIYQGKAEDLSAGGINFSTSQNLPIYSYIYIYLYFSQVTLQNIIGKIIRKSKKNSSEFNYGVKFTAIFEDDRKKILEYVNQKS